MSLLHTILPQTSGRYYFDEAGVLNDCVGEMKTTQVGSKIMVEVVFDHGLETMDLAVLTAVSFLRVKLPFRLWKRVVPIFADGNPSNTSPANIRYRFDRPIEVDRRPGYFYVPYYTGYAVNKQGDMINVKTGKIMTWSIKKPRDDGHNAKQGYYITGAYKDANGLTGCYRHRALCLTFLEYDTDPTVLVCNHKDGVPGNDALDNLELVTRAENNQHAIDSGLTPNSVIPVIVKNLNTGEEWRYPSVAKAAIGVDMPHPTLLKRLTVFSHVRFEDGIVMKRDDGSEWPALTVEKKSPVVRRVVARNIFTGQLIIAEDCSKMSNVVGVNKVTILVHCSKRLVGAVAGYNFRFRDEVDDFPNHSEKHLRIYKRYPKEAPSGVIVLNSEGVEVAFHESVELAAQAYKRSITTVNSWCRGAYNPFGYIFKLYKLNENLGSPHQVTGG